MKDLNQELMGLQLSIRNLIEKFEEAARHGKDVEAYLLLESIDTSVMDLLSGLTEKGHPPRVMAPMHEALRTLGAALSLLRYGNNLVAAYLTIRNDFGPTYERCHQEFTALLFQVVKE